MKIIRLTLFVLTLFLSQPWLQGQSSLPGKPEQRSNPTTIQPSNHPTLQQDSLEQLAANGKDTVRIQAMIRLAVTLRQTDPDRAMRLFSDAIRIARDEGYPELERRGHSGAGITCGMRGDYPGALEHFQNALDIDRSLGDSMLVAADYSNFGIVYKYLGNYGRSLSLYYNAMHLYDSLGNRSGLASAYSNLGVVHDLLEEPDRALECYTKSMEINRELGEDPGALYANIGLLRIRTGDYDEALKYLSESLESTRKSGRKMQEAEALQNIGHVYWLKKEYDPAVDYNRQALTLYRALGKKNGEHGALWNLGQVYLDRGQTREALQLAGELLAVTESLGSPVYAAQAHRLVARIYASAGQYRKAWEHQEQYSMLRDSVFNEEKAQAYEQWQTRLELTEKDHALKSQDLQLDLLQTRVQLETRIRLLLAAALALFAVALFIFWNRYRLRQRANRELEARNQLIEAQKAEIQTINKILEQRMLRAQINPHFLFNALSSIQHFITVDDRKSSLRYLSRFSALLRQMLEQSTTNQALLADEIKLLQNYIELEALRFESGFTWLVEADPDLDIHNIEVPILLVQPYVENAILHGLAPKKGQGHLSVRFTDAGAYTLCTIRDNGIGRQAAQDLKSARHPQRPSRGLEISERRLALLSADTAGVPVQIRDLYDDNGGPAGTEVLVHIPKILK